MREAGASIRQQKKEGRHVLHASKYYSQSEFKIQFCPFIGTLEKVTRFTGFVVEKAIKAFHLTSRLQSFSFFLQIVP